jgi:endonuclease/exonuclease/phosphatase (EEP) superfamily protein YafD
MTKQAISGRDVLSVIGWMAVSGPAWLAISELLGVSTPHLTAVAQTVLHWFVLPTGLLCLLAHRFRFRPLAVTAGFVTLSLTWSTLWPLRPHAQPVVGSDDVTFTMAFNNIYNNSRRGPEAIETLLAAEADVLAVAEMTTVLYRDAISAGINDRYPYRYGVLSKTGDGMWLWSRFPISAERTHQFGHPALEVTLTIRGRELHTWIVHPLNQGIGDPDSRWDATVSQVADETALSTGATLVVGDFNATLGHPPLRRMLDNGYREVHAWLGHGLSPSWPMDQPGPPLFRIDHAFVRGGVAPVEVRELVVPGSDHRGFVATYVFT